MWLKLKNRLHFTAGMILLAVMGVIIFSLPVLADTNPNVVLFEVQGNAHIPTARILGVISNTKIGEPLDPKNVQLDMQAISGLGYFVDVQAKTESILGGVKLIFTVVENPVFKELQISGTTQIKPEELLPYFTQKPGEIFNTTVFREDLGKALKFCSDQKGFYVQPKNGKLDISPSGVVRLGLVELKYGSIKVQGLVKTKDLVVLRELSFKEGDIIDINAFKDDWARLMRLRLFNSINPEFQPAADPEKLNLTLNIQEAQVGTISGGVSYVPGSGEIGGMLSYSDPNLMGRGQNLSLDVNLAPSSNNVTFSFYEPWLDASHTSFGMSLGNTETTMSSTMTNWFPNSKDVYTMNFLRTGLGLWFDRPISTSTTGRVRFNFEKNDIASYQPAGPGAPDKPMTFWDNSLQLQLFQNKLQYQDAFFVKGGYYLSGSYNFAGKMLGGAYDYQKVNLEGKAFHQITSDLVLGTHLEGNYLTGSYPDYDLLYLGGMRQLRGYSDLRFSSDVTRQLIGNETLLANAELRYRPPVNKNIELVLFGDLGQVINTNTGMNTLKSDYGAGFRFNVPFLGVMGFDYFRNAENQDGWVFMLGDSF